MNRSRYDLLDAVESVPFDTVYDLLLQFIERAILADKKKRWIDLSRTPGKLYKKFSGFWNSLDTSKMNEFTPHRTEPFSLRDQDYVYYDMDKTGFLLSAEQAEQICLGHDGFLFGLNDGAAYFFTHEDVHYKLKGSLRKPT